MFVSLTPGLSQLIGQVVAPEIGSVLVPAVSVRARMCVCRAWYMARK